MKAFVALVLSIAFMLPASTAAAAEPAPAPQHTPGRPMAVTGSVLIIASAGGYVAMAVGLGIGNESDAQVRSLQAADEVERRREVMDRGRLGNRLALGAGLASVALMATGIALVVVGRRKAEAATSVGLLPLERGAGIQLGARF